MKAAYLYQTINFISAIIMLPLLLYFLEVNEYILWAIFTTLGGLTLQIESAIQVVTVREIARQHYSYANSAMKDAIKKTVKAYLILVIVVLVIFFPLGIFYLNFFVVDKVQGSWNLEWLIFIMAYAINYLFGRNNSLLLGMRKVSIYNYTNTFTRAINLLFVYLFLKAGYSVLGITLSFLISVLIGCFFLAYKAQRVILEFYRNDGLNIEKPKLINEGSSSIFLYTIFTLCAFLLYKGGVLIVTGFYPKEVVGSYALAIQVFTMLSTIALVPVQVWVSNLVNAIATEDQQLIVKELWLTMLAVNLLFIIGTVFLLFFGEYALQLMDSKVGLLNEAGLILMSFAFLVELNIFLLVNFLITKRNYSFIKLYLKTSLTGFFLAILSIIISENLIISLLVLPMIVQCSICVPRLFAIFCKELDVTTKTLCVHIGRILSADRI